MESKSIVTAYNKSYKNNAFQLPKISRTVLTQSQIGPFDINRYEWLTEQPDYSQMTIKQVEQEYRVLRRELLAVNDTAAKSLEMLKTQTSAKRKRATSSDYHSEVMSQEIQNNKSILLRLRDELQRLQVRQKQLESNGKQTVEEMIQETKASIERTKLEIKEVVGKNREFNNSWDRESKIEEEIKHLEIQRQILERKRAKLQTKTREVSENNEKICKQLGLITEDSAKAEEMIEEQLQVQKQKEEQEQMENTLKHKRYQSEALQKNIESIRNAKTMKYHQALKKIEEIASKQTRDEVQLNQLEQRIIISKQELERSEDILRQAKATQKQSDYEDLLQEDPTADQFTEKPQTHRQGSKASHYSARGLNKNDLMARLSVEKRQTIRNGQTYRLSSNKNKTIDAGVDGSENKESIHGQSLIEPTAQSAKAKHRPELLKSSSKKKQQEFKEAAEVSQKKKAKESKGLNQGVYQKLKTWNEEASIEEIQGSKTNHKKVFNKVLINTKEPQKSQQSKQVVERIKISNQKVSRLDQVEVTDMKEKATKKTALKADQIGQPKQPKQRSALPKEKENRTAKQSKHLEPTQQIQHLHAAQPSTKSQEPTAPKQQRKSQPLPAKKKPEGHSKQEELVGDEYIEQFEKSVEKQKQNMSKGVRLVISLNDVESSLKKQKGSAKAASKYDSIQEEIVNEEEQLLG